MWWFGLCDGQLFPFPDKKKSGFGGGFFKRFRKKRSQSADRSAHSLRESAGFLRPPEPSYGAHSKGADWLPVSGVVSSGSVCASIA